MLGTIGRLALSLVGGTFGDWVKSQSAIAETKARARAEAVSQGIPGWSDEWLVIVWSFPAVACFVPGLDTVATAGIENFNNMPDWYKGGFITVTAAVFGIDKFIKWKR